jgi:hypothetical protein
MSSSEELLQDAIEPGMHRARARRALMIQGIVIIIVAIISIPISGAKTTPLYMPLGWFLVILLGGGILLSIEAFIFKGKEIEHVESNSKRYIIAKYSMRDAAWLALLAFVIGVILIIPPVKTLFNDLSAQNRSDSIYGYKCVNFPSMDWLGLSQVTEVWARPTEGSTEVYLLTKADGDRYCVNREGDQVLSLALVKGNVTSMAPFSYRLDTHDLQEFTIIIHPLSNKEVLVEYGLKVRVLDIVLPTLGALVLVYGIINGAFAAIAYNAKKRFSEGSIYRE